MRNICLIWRGLAYVALVVASSIVICACGDDSSAGAKDNSQLGDSSIPSEDLEILGSCEDGLDGRVVGIVDENGETDYLCKSGTWTAISEEEAFCVLNPLLCRERPVETCSSEEEGQYKTVSDTILRYQEGHVLAEDLYYHCVEGEWVKTEYRGPVESCTAENEGVVDTFTVYSGRFHTDYYFICNDGVWKETGKPAGPSVSEQCTKEDTKVGDTCVVYRPSENEGSLGLAGTSVKYVYTEAGEWEPVCQLAANGECKEE
ncbi:MAG: hypothetical protein MJZ26_04670 [Fibrobacter sp.]|nr:hypothetical protein [Fibrobacter sp.]